jgi:hypothetical protein
VVIGGLFCASVVIVECCIVSGKWVQPKIAQALAVRASFNQKKRMAIKNLAMIKQEHAETLRFLKAGNVKRFPAPGFNALLTDMRDAYLLEIDDPSWAKRSWRSGHSQTTYFIVPDYVWDSIDEVVVRLGDSPIPRRPPWEKEPNPLGWMGR